MSLSPANGNVWGLYAGGGIAGDPVGAVHTGATSTEARTTSGYSATTWTHACGVFLSNSSRTAFINGGSSGTAIGAEQTASSATQLEIAVTRVNGSPIVHFNGRIAEVGIWNTDLTNDEIASLAKGITCDKVRPQNLVFHAPLVRDLIDVRGGLAISNNNAASVANHPRIYA